MENFAHDDRLKIFVSIRKDLYTDVEYKKIILMVDANDTISKLKRKVEQEFTDLFPFEQAFFCSKLQDEYGYALSNSSRVKDLLRQGDRVVALPVSKEHGGKDALSSAASLDENFSMVVSMLRNITVKFANSNLSNYDGMYRLLEFYIPLGFIDKKDFMSPISGIIKAFALTENYDIFKDSTRRNILRNLVTLLVFWLNHSLMVDSYFATNVIESIQLLLKSQKFSVALKNARVTRSLIQISKSQRIAAQVKSRIVRIIKYLSLSDFTDKYNSVAPNQNRDDDYFEKITPIDNDYQHGINKPASRRSRRQIKGVINASDYTPSFKPNLDFKKPPKSSGGHSHSTKRVRYNFDNERGQDGDILTDFVNKSERNIGALRSSKDGGINGGIFGVDDGNNFESDHLYVEYLSLLEPSNTQELITYGVQNLAPLIDDAIYSILTSKNLYFKLINLIELNLPVEQKKNQLKILNSLSRNLTEDRAVDGIDGQVIERILNYFNRQGVEFHDTFSALIFSHIKQSNYKVKVNGLIEMLKSPYINLQDLAAKILKEISSPNLADSIPGVKNQTFNIQFENHVRYLLESTLSKSRSIKQINTLLEVCSNLSLNNYLHPEIIHHRGIETFLYHLREKANVEGQRLSAKGLLNLGCKSRENKLRIVSELNYEIKAMHRGELDKLVSGYVSALVQSRGE